MPHYRLIAFDCRARVEAARYMMALGDIEYEDVRMDFMEWKKAKPAMPFGQLPVLEIDGEMLAQTRSIFRYLAKQAGLAGTTDLEAARIDMLAECAEEIADVAGMVLREPREKGKARARETAKQLLKDILMKLEELCIANGGLYLAGDKLSWADLILKTNLDGPMVFNHIEVDLSGVPRLAALLELIDAHPKIASWMARRPITDF